MSHEVSRKETSSQGAKFPIPLTTCAPNGANISRMETRDWFLQDWARLKGKKQAQLVSELDWQKARASKVWNGHIPYKRDLVNELARWLGIEPFELLMHPDQALALRAFRRTAEQIASQSYANAAEDGVEFDHGDNGGAAPKSPPRRTGTGG